MEVLVNREQAAGICRQIAGMVGEFVGKLTGDRLHAANARRTRQLGEAQERRGIERAESQRQLKRFLHRHRDWHAL